MIAPSCDLKSSAHFNSEAEKLENEGKYEEAILLLDKAIQKDQNNIYALTNRGIDKSILEDYVGSMDDHSKIIEIDPDNTLAFFNRGIAKTNLNDYQGAIVDFEKAIETKGGETLYIDKVENSHIDQGVEFDVEMKKIRFERGLARYHIESPELAFDDFNFCIEENYNKPTSLYMRGIIHLILGMKQEGCIDLKEAHKLGETYALETITQHCK